jgi:hypothetical protein
MTISATSSTSGLDRMMAATRQGLIPVSELKRIDASMVRPLSELAVTRAPPLPPRIDPTSMMDAMRDAGLTDDGDPSKVFAEVYKDGKVVARLYNGGGSATYGQADGIITGENEPYDGGPQLAQWRANKIASAVGGTVKPAQTAQTQSQWEVSHAAEQARRDQVMAPYRAAMDAWKTQVATFSSDPSAGVLRTV